MPFSDDFHLPSEESLNVEEINLTTASLQAGAHYFGKYCEEQSKEFILCRSETRDPRKCIEEGKLVTACGLEFFRKMKASCFNEFQTYARCLDRSSPDFQFEPCRKTQIVYDECVSNKLDIEKPSLGYYGRPKIHNSKRPKPEPVPRPEFEKPPKLSDEEIRKAKDPTAYGSRLIFVH